MDPILNEIDAQQDKILQLLVTIAQIPSPTGHEQKKIQFLKKKIHGYGVMDVTIDRIGNCIAKIPSISPNKKNSTLLLVAHADTACDSGKQVIKEDKKYIYGHGVCDNSAGITGLLTTIELICTHRLEFPHNLIFGFTVGEEGLGAKRGMKQIIKDYGEKIDAVVNVESHPIGRITNQVIGQYRLELAIDTKAGGHSFRDFGKPNANVILAQIISDFSHVKLPQTKGKTTFNAGNMKSEGSINSISRNASCLFEIRSENNQHVQEAIKEFKSILKKYKKRFLDVEITTRIFAEVPAVVLPINHRIYQLTIDAQKKLGIKSKINSGNTDGDVSFAANIPTVTIGTSEGWNTHSLNEYLEKQSLSIGIKQVFMVISTIGSNY